LPESPGTPGLGIAAELRKHAFRSSGRRPRLSREAGSIRASRGAGL
jgi:hypothetical protein